MPATPRDALELAQPPGSEYSREMWVTIIGPLQTRRRWTVSHHHALVSLLTQSCTKRLPMLRASSTENPSER